MDRRYLVKIHATTGFLGFFFILSFWLSTLISELFMSYETIAMVKQSILYAFIFFIPTMIIAGMSGSKLSVKVKHPNVLAKKKRMPFIVINGLIILLPSAFYLSYLASLGRFGSTFYIVQGIELIVGAANLTLMGLNIRDGLGIRRRKRAV
ncbi:hypothetical protein ACS8FB_10120 [Psychrobacter sp. 1U1]|uniref:hypothetical protein n=1 Tax=Psychrobacter sp. 1U1 TaxID=3453576 RepID=UPI003F4602DB